MAAMFSGISVIAPIISGSLASNYLKGGGIIAMVAIITSRTKMVMRPSITFLFSISPFLPPKEAGRIIALQGRTV